MKAGPLRSVVVYQVPTGPPVSDELGQLQTTWANLLTVRGAFSAPRGSEATVALQVKAFVSVMFETRFPGYCFDPNGRLVDVTDPARPKTYNIVSSVDPDNRRRRLTTMLTELASTAVSDPSNL